MKALQYLPRGGIAKLAQMQVYHRGNQLQVVLHPVMDFLEEHCLFGQRALALLFITGSVLRAIDIEMKPSSP